MLIRYGFSNFRSFYDYQDISFVASSLKDEQADSIEKKLHNLKLLPSIGIYGANASGKSNSLLALRKLVNTILHSNKYAPDYSPKRSIFKLQKSASNELSHFDIDFICEEEHYHYGFEQSNNRIESEWLYKYNYTNRKARSVLYHRDINEEDEGGEFYFGKSLKGKNKFLSEITLPNKLFLSVAANNNHEQLSSIYKYFNTHFNFRFNVELSEENIAERLKDKEIKVKTSQFLRSLGTGVSSINIEQRELTEFEKKIHAGINDLLKDEVDDTLDLFEKDKKNKLNLVHLGEDDEEIIFDFDDESLGTQAMMSLLPNIFLVLKEGGAYIVDEIESSMHSILTTSIIKLFNDKETNPQGAQLFFTTHESHILSGDFIRRDQVYLCEKSCSGNSFITPLSEFDIKKGDNLRKGYLEGRFGAIPYSTDLAGLLAKTKGL